MVGLTESPHNEDLIRRSARLAQRLHGELLGVHVGRGEGLVDKQGDRLAEHRQLLEDLGGEYHEVVGDDVASALVDFALAQNATQVVLGSSRRSRWAELVQDRSSTA